MLSHLVAGRREVLEKRLVCPGSRRFEMKNTHALYWAGQRTDEEYQSLFKGITSEDVQNSYQIRFEQPIIRYK